MYKTTELDLDTTVKLLLENELGILLFQSDDSDIDIYKILSDEYSYKEKQGMYGNNIHITYHLYKLAYNSNVNECYYTSIRMNAIQNIFNRWTEKGYNKQHAKNPFNCKQFMKYLEEIELMKTDYMLILEN